MLIKLTCSCCDDDMGVAYDLNLYGMKEELYCRNCLYVMYKLHTALGLSIEEAQERYPYYALAEWNGQNARKYDSQIIDKIPELCGYGPQFVPSRGGLVLDHCFE